MTILRLEGCYNARDLGGLKCSDGRPIRPGVFVRADDVDRLTEADWEALVEHGVRTVIDLRNEDERAPSTRPHDIETLWLPLDASDDREFWDEWGSGPQFGTPLFYLPHLARHPRRSGAVLRAIAQAQDGVLFHCSAGRDRTGLVALLLLSLLGVDREAIADDYEASHAGLRHKCRTRGEPDHEPAIRAFLEGRGTTFRGALLDAHDGLDLVTWRAAAGVGDEVLERLREHALGESRAHE